MRLQFFPRPGAQLRGAIDRLHHRLRAVRTPCPFHPDCVEAVRRAAERFGYPSMEVVSGAGHDAIYTARCAPSGMIFVPCKDGISHNEIEDAKAEHLTAGCNVLLHAMLERAGGV